MGTNFNCKKIMSLLLIGVMLTGSVAVAAERMAVVKSIANIRSGPGTKKDNLLWQVEKYHPFLILQKEKKWYYVKDFEGDTAWIHNSLLGKTNTVITKKTNCNVRSKPDKKSAVLFEAERGVPFKVLKRKGNWIKIEHADGETGWIYKTLVW